MATHIIQKKNSIVYEDPAIAPKYKPRYVLEETKESLLTYHNRNESILSYLRSSFCSLRCVLRLCCGSKWRILVVLFLGVTSYFFNSMLIESAMRSMDIGGYTLARKESFHFFDDIPHSKWYLLRKRVHKIRRKQEMQHKQHKQRQYTDARKFYQHNYPAEFTCPNEERVGGTKGVGGKWLCNPQNIRIASADRVKNNGNGCLIYTSSADTKGFQFESTLLNLVGNDCQIHVFDPNDTTLETDMIPPGVHLHPWGFRSNLSTDDNPRLKTIQETVTSLGHEGYTIDLFSLDCEGCEFDIYNDFVRGKITSSTRNLYPEYVAPVFMQIIIQVHGAPAVADDFFREIQRNGYVIFHKSPSAEGTGKEQDYGFLKLSQEFFISD